MASQVLFIYLLIVIYLFFIVYYLFVGTWISVFEQTKIHRVLATLYAIGLRLEYQNIWKQQIQTLAYNCTWNENFPHFLYVLSTNFLN